MCVRYTLHKPDEALAAIAAALACRLAPPPEWVRPQFNATLTHVMPVISAGVHGPELQGMVWGIAPFQAMGATRRHDFLPALSQPALNSSMGLNRRLLPNAKAETAATLSTFKQSVATRRCLIPANGFYEWQTLGKMKLPHLFTLRDEAPFAFAGIWEPDDGALETQPTHYPLRTTRYGSFAILTTSPNDLMVPIHNRMPVILTAETMPRWLGHEPLPAAEYRTLTQPLSVEQMQQRPVSRYVSNSRHEGPACHAPPEVPPPEEIRGGESDFCLF
jgi:putative SOS response-associated peptidase YedK